DGIEAYLDFLDVVRSLDVQYGYEFIDQDWVLEFPSEEVLDRMVAAASPPPFPGAPRAPDNLPSATKPERPAGSSQSRPPQPGVGERNNTGAGSLDPGGQPGPIRPYLAHPLGGQTGMASLGGSSHGEHGNEGVGGGTGQRGQDHPASGTGGPGIGTSPPT